MEGRIWEGVVRDYVQEGGTYCDGSVEHATQGDVRAAVPRSMLALLRSMPVQIGRTDCLDALGCRQSWTSRMVMYDIGYLKVFWVPLMVFSDLPGVLILVHFCANYPACNTCGFGALLYYDSD
jgi:hypothetical protein